MSKLRAATIDALPSSDFSGPDRSYPIPDASHARNALARVSQHGSPALKARVRAKVERDFPEIKVAHHSGGGAAHPYAGGGGAFE